MNNPTPLLGFKVNHRLVQEPNVKDLTINVETEILEYDYGPIKRSFSFSPHKFVDEEDESWYKKELYYFLIGVGIEEEDAKFMIVDMILYVLRNIEDLRGVVTLLLNVQFPSIEPIEEQYGYLGTKKRDY